MLVDKSWLDLAVVSIFVLGIVTLMLVIRAADRGRARREILKTTVMVWAAVAITLTVAWLFELYAGGAVFDLQVTPEPRMVTRALTASEMTGMAVIMVVLLGLYLTTILAVKRLLEPREDDAADPMQVREDDDRE
jgi:hypothetical protein